MLNMFGGKKQLLFFLPTDSHTHNSEYLQGDREFGGKVLK